MHPEEKRARRLEAQAARAAKRGDGRQAEALCASADRIRREAGLPSALEQLKRIGGG